MTTLYIFLGIIVFFVIGLTLWNKSQRKLGNTEERAPSEPEINIGSGCCGQHEVCERDSLIAAFSATPEYFDDEELDAYSGTDADNYTENQVEEFRQIFYTLLNEDKPKWVRSLQQRNIEVPNQLKDEILMIINDLRQQKMHS